jgi:hypothetical protein
LIARILLFLIQAGNAKKAIELVWLVEKEFSRSESKV